MRDRKREVRVVLVCEAESGGSYSELELRRVAVEARLFERYRQLMELAGVENRLVALTRSEALGNELHRRANRHDDEHFDRFRKQWPFHHTPRREIREESQ